MENKYFLTQDGRMHQISDDELYHYGVLGMKWGVRRFQNKDGSLTAAGKKKQGNLKTRGERKAAKAKEYFNKASKNSLLQETYLTFGIWNNNAAKRVQRSLTKLGNERVTNLGEARSAKLNAIEAVGKHWYTTTFTLGNRQILISPQGTYIFRDTK